MQTSPSTNDVKQVPNELAGGDQLITERELAGVLATTAGAIRKARCTGALDIAYVKIGRAVRYRVSDVLSFIERNTHQARKK